MDDLHRIAFYADTHYKSDGSTVYWTPPADLDVEAIVLGGDIHYHPDHLAGMLRQIRASQRPETTIVFVPGNGDYIDQDLASSRAAYRAAVAGIPNAVFLDDASTVLSSGVRVIGSTLWSYVAEDAIDAQMARLAEYGLKGVDNITVGECYLTFVDTNRFHEQARSFIENELRSLSPEQRGETIVCTHFWPTMRWMEPDNENHRTWSTTVSTDLDDLIRECGPRYWLCGHLHETKSATIGSTEVRSNPRAGNGAGNANPDFDESYIITFRRL